MRQGLYRQGAKYYDLVYSSKDYGKEAAKLVKLIKKYKKSSGKELLDVACGTGKHLEYLVGDFSCVGADLNDEVLNIARKRLPKIEFHVVDMVDFNLDRQFDVITCLFSAIGYTKTYENLEKTWGNFAKHLKSGGVVIVEPWLTKEMYKLGIPHMATYEDENLKIARLNVSQAEGDISILDFHFLVAEEGKEVRYFKDHHELGMFDIERTLVIAKKAGFDIKFTKQSLSPGRGLFIGVKQ